jgi:hypothetical protein
MMAAGLLLVSSVLPGEIGSAPHKRESQLQVRVIRISRPGRGGAVQSHRADPAQQRRASESNSRC